MPKYFSSREIYMLQPRLIDMLEKAREFADVPFVITCGYRSPEHNAEIGGAPNSAHTRGLAVDIACVDSRTRYRMIRGLIFAGFTRLEIAPSHLHADVDETLAQDVLWLGDDH